ncbi:hypothetical protein [Rhodospirillaceae bacterium SYSU D60014]|uniref:hypothetical protein n=1 Tax=Virgifigura deserti TaxID=2268457 RepID=UPI000E66A259
MTSNRNEGEGSRTAARAYNKGTREHSKTHDVDAEAKRAREALAGKEGDSLREAEQRGKAHAKDEDPAIKRDH